MTASNVIKLDFSLGSPIKIDGSIVYDVQNLGDFIDYAMQICGNKKLNKQ